MMVSQNLPRGNRDRIPHLFNEPALFHRASPNLGFGLYPFWRKCWGSSQPPPGSCLSPVAEPKWVPQGLRPHHISDNLHSTVRACSPRRKVHALSEAITCAEAGSAVRDSEAFPKR